MGGKCTKTHSESLYGLLHENCFQNELGDICARPPKTTYWAAPGAPPPVRVLTSREEAPATKNALPSSVTSAPCGGKHVRALLKLTLCVATTPHLSNKLLTSPGAACRLTGRRVHATNEPILRPSASPLHDAGIYFILGAGVIPGHSTRKAGTVAFDLFKKGIQLKPV